MKETHCCKSRMEIYFSLVLWFFIFYFAFHSILCVKLSLKNSQVMVTSWVTAVGLVVSQSPDCWSSCNVPGKMKEGGDDDSKDRACVEERR